MLYEGDEKGLRIQNHPSQKPLRVPWEELPEMIDQLQRIAVVHHQNLQEKERELAAERERFAKILNMTDSELAA